MGTARKRCLKCPNAIHVLPRQKCIPHGVSMSCGSAGTRKHRHFPQHSGCWERKVYPGQVWRSCGNTAGLSLMGTCGAAAVPQGRDQDFPEAQVSGKAHQTTHMPACSCRSRHSIDICGCPQASPETDGLTTRVLEFSILTGALRRGSRGLSSAEGWQQEAKDGT